MLTKEPPIFLNSSMVIPASSMTACVRGLLMTTSTWYEVSSVTVTSMKPASLSNWRYRSLRIAPEIQPTYASTEFFIFSGSSLSKTISDTANLPLGFSTRNASWNTFFLSGDRLMTQLEIITSTESASTGEVFNFPASELHVGIPAFFCVFLGFL